MKGFAQNRVTQADKLDKLRECLFGEAKRLVPQSITSSVDDAIKVLDQAYGDPIRLFNYRQDYFFKLGKQPKKTEKGGYKAQVEWLRDVEVVMEGLLSLALKDKACASILFSVETMRKYLSSFDTYEFEKLVQCEGLGELRFRMWLFKVGQFRERAQSFAKETDTGSTVTNSRSSKVTPASGNSNRVNHSAKHQPTLAMFKPPRRHEDCRICNQLSKQGDTSMLYDNHSSNYPSGCPRFIGMTIAERAKICKNAKICIKCNDPSYVWKYADIKADKHKCVSKSSKSRYICKNSNCSSDRKLRIFKEVSAANSHKVQFRILFHCVANLKSSTFDTTRFSYCEESKK